MQGILFLDFDGVINPYMYKQEVIPDRKKWLRIWKHPGFLHISNYTIGQVNANFDVEACQYVKNLCDRFDLKIVVTSSWKEFYSLKQIKALLSLRHLDSYVIGTTSKENQSRSTKIKAYIEAHHINVYLVLDDIDMRADFPDHCIKTYNLFSKEQYELAIQLLEVQHA
jgi:hypothetical protein